jgi:hypothetical protein
VHASEKLCPLMKSFLVAFAWSVIAAPMVTNSDGEDLKLSSSVKSASELRETTPGLKSSFLSEKGRGKSLKWGPNEYQDDPNNPTLKATAPATLKAPAETLDLKSTWDLDLNSIREEADQIDDDEDNEYWAYLFANSLPFAKDS